LDNLHNVTWAAGFFEGEGYVGFTNQWNKTYSRNYPRLVVSISQVFKEPLEAFRDIFNVGTVRGPYGPYSTTKQAYYQYMISGEKAEEILNKMQPFLFRKGEQARIAIAGYTNYNDIKHAA
jgi:hypothetical protein